MKFGVIWIDRMLDTSLHINIGNEIQHYYAIVQLYREMGITDRDIVPVSYSERASFSLDGNEKLILPINEALFYIGDDRQFSLPFPLHDNVIPVFLGISLLGRTALPDDVIDYMRKFEPVGCRDEFTMEFLKSFGIEAYLFGCVSLTLPLRPHSDHADKFFLVDIPDEFRDYIPKNILKDEIIVEKTHGLPEENKYPNAIRRFKICDELLKSYAKDAKIVVTSRLHCVLPCIAMGIPVIYVSENHSKRFAWIDKYLRIYTRSEWEKIDWSPLPIEIEEIKSLMKLTAKAAIMSAAIGNPIDRVGFSEISAFWQNRPTYCYENFVVEVIEKELSALPDGFKYIIWGVGLIGERVYQEITKRFPSAEMILAVDSFVRGEFHGKTTSLPYEILKYKDALLFIATYTGKKDVSEWISKNVLENKCVFFSSTSG